MRCFMKFGLHRGSRDQDLKDRVEVGLSRQLIY